MIINMLTNGLFVFSLIFVSKKRVSKTQDWLF